MCLASLETQAEGKSARTWQLFSGTDFGKPWEGDEKNMVLSHATNTTNGWGILWAYLWSQAPDFSPVIFVVLPLAFRTTLKEASKFRGSRSSWKNMELMVVAQATLPETNSNFAPENEWLEDGSFPFGARHIFRGELLVLGRVVGCLNPIEIYIYIYQSNWIMMGWISHGSHIKKSFNKGKISINNLVTPKIHRKMSPKPQKKVRKPIAAHIISSWYTNIIDII